MGGALLIAETEFDRLFKESVDESFQDLLGENLRNAIYIHFEKNHAIPKENIALELDRFGAALDNTFGVSSRTIGKHIARVLYRRLGLQFVEQPNICFLDYIKVVKPKR